MCTAISYKTRDHYFGRTLDYEFSYGEDVTSEMPKRLKNSRFRACSDYFCHPTLTPRNYPFYFRNSDTVKDHYALIGMAHVAENYPLYYDAVNEKGLCMAGLNFVGNACYNDTSPDKYNVSQFEFIPWILSQCASVKDAIRLIRKTNLTATPFNEKLPVARLHWLIADRDEAIAVESVREGMKIHPDAVGVLTNDPPFDCQLFNLNKYMHLSPKPPENLFSDRLEPTLYSRGMGALGLPGDLSSQSRFVRAAFVKLNSVSGDGENESISQFFHILGSVEQQRGCCDLGNGKYEITVYTSCCNADKGIYYYTTYGNHRITAVHMHHADIDGDSLIRYPLICDEQIKNIN